MPLLRRDLNADARHAEQSNDTRLCASEHDARSWPPGGKATHIVPRVGLRIVGISTAAHQSTAASMTNSYCRDAPILAAIDVRRQRLPTILRPMHQRRTKRALRAVRPQLQRLPSARHA